MTAAQADVRRASGNLGNVASCWSEDKDKLQADSERRSHLVSSQTVNTSDLVVGPNVYITVFFIALTVCDDTFFLRSTFSHDLTMSIRIAAVNSLTTACFTVASECCKKTLMSTLILIQVYTMVFVTPIHRTLLVFLSYSPPSLSVWGSVRSIVSSLLLCFLFLKISKIHNDTSLQK